MQAPGTSRDVSSLASYALGLACGVLLRFGFVVNETTDAYRYMITPLPPIEKLTLIDRA